MGITKKEATDAFRKVLTGAELGKYLACLDRVNEELLKQSFIEADDDPQVTFGWLCKTMQVTEPVTIVIYDPHENPDAYDVTFKNPQKFEKFLDRGAITSLFKDGQSPGIDDFDDLVHGATYTTALRNIPEQVSNLERFREHLVRQREQELAWAVIDDLASEGVQAEELSEEAVAKGEQGDAGESDVVVRFEDGDGMGFVVGTYVSGDSDIGKLEKKIQERYTQRAPFAGCPIQKAFMAEAVKPGQLDKLKATCREKGVRLYARNGRSITRVQLKASIRLW